MKPARLRRLILVIALTLTAWSPGALTSPACADEGSAALVVDTGETSYTYCVALDGRVSGLELIVLAGEQHGLSYRFGFGGEAVCMLAGVGPTGDDCFEQYPDFWGYWRGNGRGGWSWSGSGAGSTSVGPGDVEGWAWGSGGDGSSHQAPPAVGYGDICSTAGAEEPRSAAQPKPDTDTSSPARKRMDPSSDATSTQSSTAGPPSSSAPQGRSRSRRSTERDRTSRQEHEHAHGTAHEPGASPAGGPVLISEAPVRETAPDGPPATGLVALGAAAVLGAAGFVVVRRRKMA